MLVHVLSSSRAQLICAKRLEAVHAPSGGRRVQATVVAIVHLTTTHGADVAQLHTHSAGSQLGELLRQTRTVGPSVQQEAERSAYSVIMSHWVGHCILL